jgi:hypothetical protein
MLNPGMTQAIAADRQAALRSAAVRERLIASGSSGEMVSPTPVRRRGFSMRLRRLWAHRELVGEPLNRPLGL